MSRPTTPRTLPIPDAEALTPAQLCLGQFILSFTAEHHYPPAVSECAEAFALTKSGVLSHLRGLEKKGAVGRAPGVNRGLWIVDRWKAVIEQAPAAAPPSATTLLSALERLAGEARAASDDDASEAQQISYNSTALAFEKAAELLRSTLQAGARYANHPLYLALGHVSAIGRPTEDRHA